MQNQTVWPKEATGPRLDFYGNSTWIRDCRNMSQKASVSELSSNVMPSRFPGPAAEFLGNVSALLPGAVFPIISSAVVESPPLLGSVGSSCLFLKAKNHSPSVLQPAGSEGLERTILIRGI